MNPLAILLMSFSIDWMLFAMCIMWFTRYQGKIGTRYLDPLPRRTIFTVWKMTIKSIMRDMFLM
jgi:hypothetical protein